MRRSLSEFEEVDNEAVLSVPGGEYLSLKAVFPTPQGTSPTSVPVVQFAGRGYDFKRVFLDVREELFSRNLRLELKGKIAEEMESSVTTPQRESFYVLHNGISVTCSEYRILTFNPDAGPPSSQQDYAFVPELDRPFVDEAIKAGIEVFLYVRNMQIVNGAQTTYTFSKLQDSELKEVKLPCKLTVTTDPYVISQIAICNNTQNAIGSWDLAANSPELTILQNYAAQLAPPIFVQRRKGEKWTQTRFATTAAPPSERSLVAREVYQAALSFAGQPGPAYSRTASSVSPGTKAYLEIAVASNLEEMLMAGLVASYEDAVRKKRAHPGFAESWTQWAVALVGHICHHHLDQAAKSGWVSSLFGSRGLQAWSKLRSYLLGFVTTFMSRFPKSTDPQRVMRNLADEWDALNDAGIDPKSVWLRIPPAAKDRSFAGMRQKQGASVTTQFYDVNFAIMAVALEAYIASKPLPKLR